MKVARLPTEPKPGLTVECMKLKVCFTCTSGLRISVTRKVGPVSKQRKVIRQSAAFDLSAVSGPFAIYAIAEQDREDDRIYGRLSKIRFDHHEIVNRG